MQRDILIFCGCVSSLWCGDVIVVYIGHLCFIVLVR